MSFSEELTRVIKEIVSGERNYLKGTALNSSSSDIKVRLDNGQTVVAKNINVGTVGKVNVLYDSKNKKYAVFAENSNVVISNDVSVFRKTRGEDNPIYPFRVTVYNVENDIGFILIGGDRYPKRKIDLNSDNSEFNYRISGFNNLGKNRDDHIVVLGVVNKTNFNNRYTEVYLRNQLLFSTEILSQFRVIYYSLKDWHGFDTVYEFVQNETPSGSLDYVRLPSPGSFTTAYAFPFSDTKVYFYLDNYALGNEVSYYSSNGIDSIGSIIPEGISTDSYTAWTRSNRVVDSFHYILDETKEWTFNFNVDYMDVHSFKSLLPAGTFTTSFLINFTKSAYVTIDVTNEYICYFKNQIINGVDTRFYKEGTEILDEINMQIDLTCTYTNTTKPIFTDVPITVETGEFFSVHECKGISISIGNHSYTRYGYFKSDPEILREITIPINDNFLIEKKLNYSNYYFVDSNREITNYTVTPIFTDSVIVPLSGSSYTYAEDYISSFSIQLDVLEIGTVTSNYNREEIDTEIILSAENELYFYSKFEETRDLELIETYNYEYGVIKTYLFGNNVNFAINSNGIGLVKDALSGFLVNDYPATLRQPTYQEFSRVISGSISDKMFYKLKDDLLDVDLIIEDSFYIRSTTAKVSSLLPTTISTPIEITFTFSTNEISALGEIIRIGEYHDNLGGKIINRSTSFTYTNGSVVGDGAIPDNSFWNNSPKDVHIYKKVENTVETKSYKWSGQILSYTYSDSNYTNFIGYFAPVSSSNVKRRYLGSLVIRLDSVAIENFSFVSDFENSSSVYHIVSANNYLVPLLRYINRRGISRINFIKHKEDYKIFINQNFNDTDENVSLNHNKFYADYLKLVDGRLQRQSLKSGLYKGTGVNTFSDNGYIPDTSQTPSNYYGKNTAIQYYPPN